MSFQYKKQRTVVQDTCICIATSALNVECMHRMHSLSMHSLAYQIRPILFAFYLFKDMYARSEMDIKKSTSGLEQKLLNSFYMEYIRAPKARDDLSLQMLIHPWHR